MAKYRKKPVVIEAMQVPLLDAELSDEFIAFVEQAHEDMMSEGDGSISIFTMEGTMRANPGDWIIKGVKGEFYPCKPEIFAATYELVE